MSHGAINCGSSYISYINIHLEQKIIDLKTGFSEHFYISQTDYK